MTVNNDHESRAAPAAPARITMDRLLTARELARYLDVPVSTLYWWRHREEGPPGFRVGKHLRYRQRDVDEWVRQQLDAGNRPP
jgi:excisionase family DNA binding protein